jgi:hypothetical protein
MELMKFYTCSKPTQQRCPYGLLPVCPEHGDRVNLWVTRQHVMVCTSCQV